MYTADDFDAMMSKRSPAYKAAIEGSKSFVLSLYICWSGTDPEGGMSMAKQLSAKHKNATIVAFNGRGHFDRNKDGKAVFMGIGKTPRVGSETPKNDDGGALVYFQNGKETKRIDSGWLVRQVINAGL